MASLVLSVMGFMVLPSFAHANKNTVAVFPYKVLNSEKEYQHLGEGMADAMINHIVRSASLRIIEESQIGKAVEHIARSQSGLYEEESALQIGKMVNARFIVIGSVEVLEKNVAINGRVLEVETAQLLVADRRHGSVSKAFDIYDELSIALTKQLLKHLSARVTTAGGDDADHVAMAELMKNAKKY